MCRWKPGPISTPQPNTVIVTLPRYGGLPWFQRPDLARPDHHRTLVLGPHCLVHRWRSRLGRNLTYQTQPQPKTEPDPNREGSSVVNFVASLPSNVKVHAFGISHNAHMDHVQQIACAGGGIFGTVKTSTDVLGQMKGALGKPHPQAPTLTPTLNRTSRPL